MLLEDVRKLKVSELRAELRDRGLDPRGLKAELVARLLSAIETPEPDKSVELKPLDQEAAQTVEESPKLTTSSGATAVTALGGKQQTLDQNQSRLEDIWTRTRSCADQGTQTENDTAVNILQSVCSCSNRREEAEQVKSQCVLTRSTSSDVHQEEVQSTPLSTSHQCKLIQHDTVLIISMHTTM